MDPVKDPFDTPVMMKTGGTELDRIVRQYLPPEMQTPNVQFVISSPTTSPAVIQGCVVGPECVKCGTRVWLAPSSQKVGAEKMAALCIICLGKILEKIPPA